MTESTSPISDAGPVPREPVRVTSPILAMVARFAVPLTVYVSLIIFCQGHNLPGGGFIAGVMVAAAGVIALLAWGVHQPLHFGFWHVPAQAILLVPWAGPTAGAMVLALGVLFWLLVRRAAMHEFAWWKLACLGLVISIMTGVVPLLQGKAFMDHVVLQYDVLIWHEHLPTATFFDLGVYLIVFGTLTTVFVELGLEGE